MKECTERTVRVGLRRNPKKVFDEVEELTAKMKREGWVLSESLIEESLGKIHLFFQREINTISNWPGDPAPESMERRIRGKGVR